MKDDWMDEAKKFAYLDRKLSEELDKKEKAEQQLCEIEKKAFEVYPDADYVALTLEETVNSKE